MATPPQSQRTEIKMEMKLNNFWQSSGVIIPRDFLIGDQDGESILDEDGVTELADEQHP